MAEIELSVLSHQCVDPRQPDFATLKAEVAAWQARTGGRGNRIGLRFTTDDARIELERLSPTLQN
jgi:hypothetical protein